MYVVTADQRASRRSADAVPSALDQLAGGADPGGGWTVYRPFERTVGDEIQGALTDAGSALRVVLWLLRSNRWHVGLGIGPVEQPVPPSVRSARGPAFLAARAAVEAARRCEHHVAIRAGSSPMQYPLVEALDGPSVRAAEGTVGGPRYVLGDEPIPASEVGETMTTMTAGTASPDPQAHARYAEAGLRLLCRLRSARTPAGWEAVDLAARGATGREIAERLGITAAAVSQRLARTGWADEKVALPLLEYHLRLADHAGQNHAGQDHDPDDAGLAGSAR